MFNKLVAVVLCFAASTALAADAKVSFSQVHARPSINGMSVAYFTVESTVNDAVTGVSSDCCKAVELHRNEKINGIMSMRRISELALKKNTPLAAQPGAAGGQHLMLIGLKQPMAEGDAVNVTFFFKKAPSQTVSVPVVVEKEADGTKDDHQNHH